MSTSTNRPHPRALDDPAELGQVRRAVQRRRPRRACAVVARPRGRRRGDQGRPVAAGVADIAKIVDHYDQFIRALDEPPIIIGHSFGGLFMQLLVDRGLGVAGVGVSAAQPRGVPKLPLTHDQVGLTDPAQPAQPTQGRGIHARGLPLHDDEHPVARGVHALLRALRHSGRRTHPVRGGRGPAEPEDARQRSTSREPTARRCCSSPTGATTSYRPRSPRRSPTSTTAKSTALVDYVEYPDRPHFPGVPGWEEVADNALAGLSTTPNTDPVA